MSRRHLPCLLAIALAFAASSVASAPVAWADGDAYRRHMENGVKLYADKNFPAAVAEFQAAFEAKPNASPLVNIALCDKELFHYPEAIGALERALAAYGDAMDPADKKAASAAITEMQGLLGKVTIAVSPASAKITVDGDPAVPSGASGVVLLGPGKHVISARAEGFASGEAAVVVTSGGEQTVKLALVAEKGQVTIEAPDTRTTISVDDEPAGNGRWAGMLSPGQHVVRMYGADGPTYAGTIVVRAGVPLLVTKDVGGTPISLDRPEEASKRGFYVLAMGSMLFALTHPPGFPGPGPGYVRQEPDYGAGYGIRAGFQVNRLAAFEVSYEHSSIYTYMNETAQYPNTPYYRIIANRIAAGLRLASKGETFRFVGSFGGGVVADQIFFNLPMCKTSTSLVAPCFLNGPGSPNHVGVDAFALLEAGLEIDIERVLIDLGAEAQIQSTGNLEANGTQGVFGSNPLVNIGPAIRVGYRFW